jgi:hypothetical protein
VGLETGTLLFFSPDPFPFPSLPQILFRPPRAIDAAPPLHHTTAVAPRGSRGWHDEWPCPFTTVEDPASPMRWANAPMTWPGPPLRRRWPNAQAPDSDDPMARPPPPATIEQGCWRKRLKKKVISYLFLYYIVFFSELYLDNLVIVFSKFGYCI